MLALVKAGKLDVSFFRDQATCLYDLEAPVGNEVVNDLINYYYLMQYTDKACAVRTSYSQNAATNNKAVLRRFKAANIPW